MTDATDDARFDWEALKRRTSANAVLQLGEVELEEVFDRRALALAHAEAQSEVSGTPLLTFRHGNTRFGVEPAYVARVLGPRKLTRIPQAPLHMDTVLYEGGRILTALSPSILFSNAPTGEPRESVLLLEAEGDLVGVRASRMLGLTRVELPELGAPSIASDPHVTACVLGVAADLTVVLDGRALVRLLGANLTE